MDSNLGGQSSPGLTPEERQRQTAAAILRQKVLAAYNEAETGQTMNQGGESSYKQEPIKTEIKNQDWQKYHSAWQNYYQQYYSEYYAKAARQYLQTEKLKQERAKHDEERLIDTHAVATKNELEAQDVEDALKSRIRERARTNFKNLRRRRHFMPLMAGAAVVLVLLFLQYNRLIFAPIMAYIAPGNSEDTGITAIDPTATVAPTADPRLLIPKLNVDVPVAFGINNSEVDAAMNNGVAQFAIPGANALPGEVGNLVISGHSAGDIYSSNQYKFIFSGLERLVAGDTIYINYESKRYTYSVTKLETVEPTDVAALIYPTNKPMLTLITCTPLGTARYRLLVTAEQVNPAPDTAKQSTMADVPEAQEEMPANDPSFFEKIWNWLTGR